MAIEAKVLAHTVNTITEDELITLQCTYHRFILPEVNTYRMISKNSASSRGIPIKKRIDMVLNNPAYPVEYGKNMSGMYSTELLENRENLDAIWKEASLNAVQLAEKMAEAGVHKQIVNRIIEPFLWQTSVFTGNRIWFEHIFEQRIHPHAQPEFRELAIKMRDAIENSVPKENAVHEPYILDIERGQFSPFKRIQLSVARCARVSYTPFNEENRDVEKDCQLYLKLIKANPPHSSPLEHYAFPTNIKRSFYNLRGFISFRYLFEAYAYVSVLEMIENNKDFFINEEQLNSLKRIPFYE